MQPGKLASDKTGVINETLTSVLEDKHPHEKFLLVLRWRHTTKRLFLFLWTLRRMWSNFSCGNIWGVQALEVQTRKLYKGGF